VLGCQRFVSQPQSVFWLTPNSTANLHVEVPQVKFRETSGDKTGETSAEIRARVIAAQKIQQKRFAHKPKIACNERLGPKELKEFCALDDSTKELLKNAMTELNFNARAYGRILKVARTIADLAGAENILNEHLSEAIQYR
jgi:magnesium chelatase family protein